MKKILVTLLLVISATFVCAGESRSLFDLYWNTTLFPVDYSMLSHGSFLEPLSESTSLEIEGHKRTDRLIGVLVNLLIPGLGSLIIGDTTGGIITMAGYYLSFAAVYGGIFILNPIISVTGLLGMLGFGIYAIVSPFTYVKNKDYSY